MSGITDCVKNSEEKGEGGEKNEVVKIQGWIEIAGENNRERET